MRSRRTLYRLLAGALVDAQVLRGAELSAEDRVALVELARFHRVEGQLAGAFEASSLVPPAELTEARVLAVANHLQTLSTLRRVTAALDGAGIEAVAVKGPVLAARWHRSPGARTYHDLDVLVEPSCFRDAIAVLTEVGFAEQNRNWAGFRSLGLGEVPLHDGTVTLDLHWHLLTFERDRRLFRLATADLLARRIPVELGSVSSWTLCDDDMLTHVVLHAGLAGARLLVHQRDVHVVAAGVDWDTAPRRLGDAGAGRLAAATLDRVERTFGRLRPAPAADAWRHGLWRGLNQAADRTWVRAVPNGRNASPSALLAAGRPTALATALVLQREVATAVRRRVGGRTITSPGGPLDLDVDAGGPAERARFLAEVERGAYGR